MHTVDSLVDTFALLRFTANWQSIFGGQPCELIWLGGVEHVKCVLLGRLESPFILSCLQSLYLAHMIE